MQIPRIPHWMLYKTVCIGNQWESRMTFLIVFAMDPQFNSELIHHFNSESTFQFISYSVQTSILFGMVLSVFLSFKITVHRKNDDPSDFNGLVMLISFAHTHTHASWDLFIFRCWIKFSQCHKFRQQSFSWTSEWKPSIFFVHSFWMCAIIWIEPSILSLTRTKTKFQLCVIQFYPFSMNILIRFMNQKSKCAFVQKIVHFISITQRWDREAKDILRFECISAQW